MAQKKLNQLIHEKSPYLRQHASNPVHWYPWCSQAFEEASRQDKPIFLSIGYSSCHWCHVMEEESFKDQEIARILNQHFISIKVDREERPDIDKTYMSVAQILADTSGWPLTIVMTPEQKPFFAATYIPKEDRYGRMGLANLLEHIKKVWDQKREQIEQSAEKICSALTKASQQPPQTDFQQSFFGRAYQKLEASFDQAHGGFGNQPKFPIPSNLLFLLRYGWQNKQEKAHHMVTKTLDSMRKGGIWDHVGFGFHRYATDRAWKVPHFEKMLYDQAMLSVAYIDAFLLTSRKAYSQTAKDMFTFVFRDLTRKEGGFYASVDADSQGEEGKYYLWTPQQVSDVLDKEHAAIICSVFNITEQGNFADAPGPQGQNILHQTQSMSALAKKLKMHTWELEEVVHQCLEKLFLARKKRKPPLVDQKILTDWNGLMIAALCKGARAFDRPMYTEEAKKAADFILNHMLDRGQLAHCWLEDGPSRAPATVEDYAYFVFGLLELYQATFHLRYLKSAYALQQKAIDLFWDQKNGGFHFSAQKEQPVIFLLKESSDAPLPSGNSVALHNLMRLSKLTSDQSFADKGQAILDCFAHNMEHMPDFHSFMLYAAYLVYHKTAEVVICGQSYARDTIEMMEKVQKQYLPHAVLIFKPAEQDNHQLDQITGFTEPYTGLEKKATAYVCSDFSCKAPTTSPDTLMDMLGQ